MIFQIRVRYMYVGLPFLSTPPLERRRVLIGSLSVAFSFEINASQLGASSGSPSTGRASCSCGTCTVTIQTSPTAEEVCAPRVHLPCVCLEASASHELYVSCWLHFFNTRVLFPDGTFDARTHKHSSLVKCAT